MLCRHRLIVALLSATALLASPSGSADSPCDDEGGGGAASCQLGWLTAPPGCDAGCVAGLLPEGVDGVWVGHSGEPASFCVGVFVDEDGVEASVDMSAACGAPGER